jgi:2'-5' RNA ligase
VRRALEKAMRALEAAGLAGKFELPEKLHVTLAFLGSVDTTRVEPLSAALLRAIADIRPFSARFETIGGFPNERRARIAWAGSRRAGESFGRLAEAVRSAAREFAGLDEKPPVLHVTLARMRDPMQLPRIHFTPCTLRVDAIVLYESLPGEGTSRYEVLQRFPLTVHASSPDASR